MQKLAPETLVPALQPRAAHLLAVGELCGTSGRLRWGLLLLVR